MESRQKSAIKAAVYTIYHITIATLIWSYVVYLATGEWENEYLESIGIGLLLYIFWEFSGYYIFERLWNKISTISWRKVIK